MSNYYISIIITICIYLTACIGLTYFTGFIGIFSFGHAAFMAIGGYVAAICTATYGLPFWLSTLLGIILAVIFALVIGIPTAKIKGTYFAIIAMGYGEVVRILIIILNKWTKGARGLPGIPKFTTLPIALICAVLSVWLVWNLVHSPIGRASKALKSDELAAKLCGVRTVYVRLFAFVVSATLCALGGALLAHFTTFLSPNTFKSTLSSQLSIVVLIGGLGSIWGPVAASILLFGLPELLRAVSDWRMTIYGAIMIATILLRPQGLFSGYSLAGIKAAFGRLSSAVKNADSRNGGRSDEE